MRIVIAYALAGIGHKKAAEALHAAAAQAGHQTQLVDALDTCRPSMRWLYPRLYLVLIKHLSTLWGWGYGLSDQQWLQPVLRPLRRLANGGTAAGFARWLVQTQPDVVLTTHFLPTEVAAALKRAGQLRARLVVVVTDFYPHAFWLAPAVDAYAVAGDTARAALIARGVPAERITITGIPIDARFARLPDADAARRHFGFDPLRRVVLVTGGGFGVGAMQRIVEALTRHPRLQALPVQLAAVCGRNPELVHALETVGKSSAVPLRVFGFMDEMPLLMAASDVMVAKPGGLTVSEALAAHLPMILYGAIPGQETHNERFLRSHEAAVSAPTPSAIVHEVVRFLEAPERLTAYRTRLAGLGHPEAASMIIGQLLEAVG